jgi:class 3 adenylate cyclase
MGVDVGAWLRGLGLSQYEGSFRDNEIDAEILPRLTADDLKDIGVTVVGHRRRLLGAIECLRAPDEALPGRDGVASTRAPAQRQAVAFPTAQAERRHLTVMFVDLVGSTALSARLDPEEMREVIRAYQDRVAGEILRYEGHVAKFMGDGVLSYFGWPRAHEDEDEDEAERAVRAGLAVAVAVAKLATPAQEPLAARIGIATGLVVVGDLLGEGSAREETIVGETPNLAARLQDVAAPGAVIVDERTRRLLGELFDLVPLGLVHLKGFTVPVEAFEVHGERPARSRFEAYQAGGPLPMIGRDQELALVLDRWRRALAGEGGAVLLVGEAGIGKSRLVRAVLDAPQEHGEDMVLRYQCSPHHTGTALWPVLRQVGFAAGLETTDTDSAKLAKLEALFRQDTDDLGDAVPLIAPLLGIDTERYPAANLTSQQRRTRTLAALLAQLLGLARHRPVLMVVEDGHWADPTTLEFLGQALDRIADRRVLMLLTSRLDNEPGLGGHPHVTRLA